VRIELITPARRRTAARRRIVSSRFFPALLAAFMAAPMAAVAQSAAVAATAAAPARAWTLREFQSLRWLEGRWRGQLPGGGFFYEERGFADDSTLFTRTYSDSTFTTVSERGETTFRGGVIASGGDRRRVSSLDASHVVFTTAGSSSMVRFDRRSNDHWTATLSGTDREGRARSVVYEMQRLP